LQPVQSAATKVPIGLAMPPSAEGGGAPSGKEPKPLNAGPASDGTKAPEALPSTPSPLPLLLPLLLPAQLGFFELPQPSRPASTNKTKPMAVTPASLMEDLRTPQDLPKDRHYLMSQT